MKDPSSRPARLGSSLIGNAGEYFVLAELLRRGIVAALAPRNMPDYDILAVDGTQSLKIRVKTKTSRADSFVWNVKPDGRIFGTATKNDVAVLVDLGNLEAPIFYALKVRDLESKMKKWYDEWLAAPGRGGRKRGETRTRRLFPKWQGQFDEESQSYEYERGHFEQYEGEKAWELIEHMLGRIGEQTGDEGTQR